MTICVNYYITIDYIHHTKAIATVVKLTAELHQAEEDWLSAGKSMASIDIDEKCFCESMTIKERCEWRIDTAEYFLQMEDCIAAELHTEKYEMLFQDMNSNENMELQIRGKACQSRIFERCKKYDKAAVVYLEITQLGYHFNQAHYILNPNDLIKSLRRSVICAILANYDDEKRNVLAMLYVYERTKSVECYDILEKMYKNVMLMEKDLNEFEQYLENKDRISLAKKVFCQHNIFVASKSNQKRISIETLSNVLKIDFNQCSDIAMEMIKQGIITASVDENNQTITLSNLNQQ
eukprot:318450_1